MKKLILAAVCAAALLFSAIPVLAQSYSSYRPHYQCEVNIGYDMAGSMNVKTHYDSGKVEKGKANNGDLARPFISTIHGVRVTKWLFLGAGLALQYAYGKTPTKSGFFVDNWNTLLVPIFGNVKFHWPLMDELSLYLTFSAGGSPLLYSGINKSYRDEDCYDTFRFKGGYYGDYGFGMNYRKFNFSVGLQQQIVKDTEVDSDWYRRFNTSYWYIKLGLMF